MLYTLLIVIYAEDHIYAECRYAECHITAHYAECHHAEFHGASKTIL